MAKKKSLKTALLTAIIMIIACTAMFAGTTFAWFTDSVTSSNNIIKAGNLDVSMHWSEAKVDPNATDTDWTDASTGAIFNYDKWEPGYVDAKHISISNDGSLALKYKVVIEPTGEVSKLAEVIDVYYSDPAKSITRKDLTDDKKIGTLKEVIASVGDTATGNLKAGEKHVVTLALKMRESAGNEYQNLSIGTSFAVRVIATQLASEFDSFDNQYDVDAPLDFIMVSSASELKTALANKNENIIISGEISDLNETLTIDYDVKISGVATISRADGFTGTMFSVADGTTLTMEKVVLDGGRNEGVTATGNLIETTSGVIVLNEGTVLQNNNGAHAVSLAKNGGGKLTLNGASIINNTSGSGAIWGGGHITMNEGSKISHNSSTGPAGAIRMVSGGSFTINGGEMNYNKSAGDGGVIWGYGSSTYNFNGGEVAYNESAGTGGFMYTGTYSVINISGTFEIHDNKAANSGAIRLTDHTSMTINGGKIYNNTQNGESNAFNTWNNSIIIESGEVDDDFSYVGGLGLTIGKADIDGVISYNLSTNHNTAYLMSEFNGFKFVVNESSANFSQFNFKPATGYVYTEGDEAKLICMNSGYETYWDASTETFRLKAK